SGRAGCVVVPVGWTTHDVRGPGVHGLGSDLAGVHHGGRGCFVPGDPDRIRLVGRTCARPEDAAPAVDARAGYAGAACAEAVRHAGEAGAGDARAGAGVLPDRPGVLLPAPGPGGDG